MAAKHCVEADLAFSGNIYTANDNFPKANHLAIKGNKIAAVSLEPITLCDGARHFRLKKGAILPGFTDAHVHLKGIGYREKNLNLQGINSLAETLQAVADYAKANPDASWVVGRGWIEKVWPEKRFPNLADIDAIVGDRPAYLTRADGHSALANSAALKLAGIDKHTQAPEGGAIEKDSKGELTGLLVDNAMALVEKLIPENTRADDKDALARGLKRNAQLGWTQTQNAGGSWQDLQLLQELQNEGQLAHRVYYALSQGDDADKLLNKGAQFDGGSWISARGIKLYSDGALGSRGAALIEPYHDAKSKGLLLIDEPTIMPILEKALRKGIQIQTHAIGDLANRLVLDWYEKAFRNVPRDEWAIANPRWRIEHSQNITPEDQDRFKQLGVIPSMQPSHAIGDLHFAPDRLGEKRLQNAYPWQSLLDKGLIIAGGSDAPVEIGDPRIEFYAASIRKDTSGFQAEGWHPELAVSRDNALKMFTLWPAYAAFEENLRGSIEVGKLADLTIFNRDIMTVAGDQILEADVLFTIIDGNIAYQKP
ncbi:amidohydrolase [Pseudoteredinibacter isoporae]|nr:amidohydrolase [Pseudoteredinibacter isoporae]NHO86455.1 amidohydrolase [Pseudoteredinibacter isoporae]NIB25093.1 amidohydrolase [Pseudoteredinibacter isoporae]